MVSVKLSVHSLEDTFPPQGFPWPPCPSQVWVLLLPNQTWVYSPACSKADCWYQVVVKGSAAFIAGTKQGVWAANIQKAWTPNGFQGTVFKDRVRKRVAGCVISSWTFFWLVGGEVIGSQHHQPSGSNQSGVCVLVVSVQLTSSTWWGA